MHNGSHIQLFKQLHNVPLDINPVPNTVIKFKIKLQAPISN